MRLKPVAMVRSMNVSEERLGRVLSSLDHRGAWVTFWRDCHGVRFSAEFFRAAFFPNRTEVTSGTTTDSSRINEVSVCQKPSHTVPALEPSTALSSNCSKLHQRRIEPNTPRPSPTK